MLAGSGFADSGSVATEFELKGQAYQLEIADNHYLRSRGLMHRTSLGRHAGMLFVYPRAGNYRIWMKNTYIPLTVIWLDAEATILDIKTLLPCISAHCPVYGTKQPSSFILELHASQVSRFQPGDQLPALLEVQ
ncbi:MAG: DUF192 domain-containing protein [Gammaproteobacteria bacterium]|nr:DUF192 domain-containing protein [Gammaproteobacteria bacterium]